jgi:hypothetical protein
MNQEKAIKKTLESKLAGSRRKERPGLRCLEDAEKDLWEMEVNRWRRKAVGREE